MTASRGAIGAIGAITILCSDRGLLWLGYPIEMIGRSVAVVKGWIARYLRPGINAGINFSRR